MSFDNSITRKADNKVGAHVLHAIDHQKNAKYGSVTTPVVHEKDGSVSYTATHMETGVKSKHTFSKD